MSSKRPVPRSNLPRRVTAAAAEPDQAAAPRRRGPGLSLARKVLLSLLVTVAFFAILELTFAAFRVKPVGYEEDPYVGFAGSSPLFVPERQADGTEMMVTARNKLHLFNLQRFPRSKGRRTYRIFCLGGSTAYGHPYTHSTSFCGWLGEVLPVADPGRDWEVVNAGGISYASYREARLVEELSRYQPDLFLVISGHNEFLERRTYARVIELPRSVRGLGAIASRTRTYAVLQRGVDAIRQRPAGNAIRPSLLEPEVTTLLDDSVGPQAFTRDDAQRDQVLRHYRFNLARMVDIARSAGAATVLISPASNLRDSSPFKSENRPGLTGAERDRWEALVAAARQAAAAGDWTRALAEVEQALAIDGRYAHLQYLAGQTYDRLGRFVEAKRAYERARDEDICPLRALGPTRRIVAEVAADRKAMLVDFFDLAERWSADGIPGNDLFLDHVHPTVDGNRRLALAILELMTRQGIVHPVPSWGEGAIQVVTARVEASLDRTAHGLALTTLSKTLGWAGKLTEAYGLARQAVTLAPDEVGTHYQAALCAQLLGRTEEAVGEYRRALELAPGAGLAHGNLGAALEAQGDLKEAVVHYRRAVELAPDPKDAARNRNNLASALVRLGYQTYTRGAYQEALSYLAEAARLEPANPDTMTKLGIALLATGRPAEAADRLSAALALQPGDGGLHNRLAVALAFSGRLDEASEQYRQALRLSPALAASAESLPAVLRARGRGEDAARLERQLGSSP